jgi:polyhydroxyalkanoate synthesis regulator phasin
MAQKRKQPDEGGFVGRLAGRGEEAVTRLVDELGRNPRVTDALGKAMSAKGKVDAGARRTLSQMGLAAADELKDLRKQIERLERRLARLEGGGSTGSRSSRGTRSSARTTAKQSQTQKKPTARKGTTTVKKDAEQAASPPPGRSLGGGAGRGSSAGGGPDAA